VVWNRRYEPQVVERDRKVKEGLRNAGLEAGSWNALLLAEPWTIRNKAGGPFQVFSPYWRHCLQSLDPAAPLPAPDGVASPRRWPAGEALDALDLLPRIPWDAGIRRDWCPGEASAVRRLEAFVQQGLAGYGTERDRPGHPGTSRLSPHLHFGEISPRQVWHSIATAAARRGIPPETWKSWQFLAEVGWREFAHHLLFHFPHTPRLPLRHEFGGFPWRVDPAALRLWQRGLTGYPLVDAGMRELWETGWMHNRVRMVTASFLVKHLLLSWEEGARWFWDTLVDADLASNTLGWQWTAGCGADAAPYFRVFNPVSQGERYDPAGEYVRRWVPELRALPNDWIHQPWAAPRDVLQAAGVRLGGSYPRPIVDHAEARTRALAAYAASRGR
jgi:deoxyribodipyrimidine photo-lyase